MLVINVLFILQSFCQLRLRIVGQGGLHCWRGEGRHVNVGAQDLFKRWMQDRTELEEERLSNMDPLQLHFQRASRCFFSKPLSRFQTPDSRAMLSWEAMNECVLKGLFPWVLHFFSSCSAARSWQDWGWCQKGSATVTVPAKFVRAILISQKYVWW